MHSKRLLASFLVFVLLLSFIPPATAKSSSDLSIEQLNSIVMLNYLSVLTKEINSSSNSRLFLEKAYSELYNNINLNSVKDSNTQYYLSSLLELIDEYRFIDVKRERLEYIYDQNCAQALRNAMPNPLGLLSAVQSYSLAKLVGSVVFMAVDSAESYKSSMSAAEMEYMKSNWELDDAEAKSISSSQSRLYNYMMDMAREYDLPDSMVIRDNDISKLVEYEATDNLASRIQFLEDSKDTYAAYGSYWLILAKSYYENKAFGKCLYAVGEYEKLQVGIFHKDIGYASILPLAIASLEAVATDGRYVREGEEYTKRLVENTDTDDWALRYFAAQTYISLFSKTNEQKYLNSAYKLALQNVNQLVGEQEKLNQTYIAELKPENEKEVPSGASKVKKAEIKNENKEIKKYNKAMEETREVELPPVSDSLRLNCDLLFSLAEQLNISDREKEKIEAILHPQKSQLFLIKPIDSRYYFSAPSVEDPEICFDGKVITIPATYIAEDAKIVLAVVDGSETSYTDWIVKKVSRPKKGGGVSDFIAEIVSSSLNKKAFSPTSLVKIDILPSEKIDCEQYHVEYKVSSYKKFGAVSVEFALVDE